MEAERRLREFVANRVNRYAAERNEPAAHATSELSPYLHFGHISSLEVEDAMMTGTQTVAFEPGPEAVEITLSLEYRIKDRTPLTPVVDLLFVRRAMADA